MTYFFLFSGVFYLSTALLIVHEMEEFLFLDIGNPQPKSRMRW